MDEARVIQSLNIDELQKSLDRIHKSVNITLYESRKKSIARHNVRTVVYPCNLVVGDYFEVSRTRGPRTKMSANWVGPCRIIQALSDFTFKVEHLVTKGREEIHISRIKPYTDALFGSTAQIGEIADFLDRIWYFFDKIKDLRETDGEFEVIVAWKGLTAAGNAWGPLSIVFEDVPSNVPAFFKCRRQSGIIKRAKKQLKL